MASKWPCLFTDRMVASLLVTRWSQFLPPSPEREVLILLTHSAAAADKARVTFICAESPHLLCQGTKDRPVNKQAGGSKTVTKSTSQHKDDPKATLWELHPPGGCPVQSHMGLIPCRRKPETAEQSSWPFEAGLPPHKCTAWHWQNCLARGPSLYDWLRVVISPH